MYSIDLAKITIDEFEEIIRTAQLLPSQKHILNHLAENMRVLKNNGHVNLHDLQDLLKKKTDYLNIAKSVGIDHDYLVILNRMVNSYVVKVLPLEKLEIFSKEELNLLGAEKIVNTKQYYDFFIAAEQREEFSTGINIPVDKKEYALRVTDLVRINGVGVDYAKILYEIGVKCVSDYINTPSETILKSVQSYNNARAYTKATLGISDIDYCRRFCDKLDRDII